MSFSSSICHHGLNTASDGDAFKSCRNLSSCLRDITETKCKHKHHARAARSRNVQAVPGQHITAPTDHQCRSAGCLCFAKYFGTPAGTSAERAPLRKQSPAWQTFVCVRWQRAL